MRLPIDILLLLFCLLLVNVKSQDWTHYTVLDAGGKYHFSWTPPDDAKGDSLITFLVELKTKGYFGLGFSPNGGMRGSDIVTGWIKDGKVYFQDRHAIANRLPPKDDQQNYELLNAYENDTFTVFEFRRRLDTCDENDTMIDDRTMRVIFAYSEKDPVGDDPFYHRENRGAKSIMLLQTGTKNVLNVNSSSHLNWDLTSPDVDISNIHTVYWCKVFKAPEVSEKHHIVAVKPLLQNGHEQFVHHILLYECLGGTPEEYEDLASAEYRGHECRDPNMPAEMHRCQGVIAGWAIGGDDLILPEHVGIPMDPNTPKYYRYEVHYDNPQHRTDIIDHSGLRLIYTPDLREFDCGTFRVGGCVLPRCFIPPHQKEYVVVGHSTPECLGSAFPETGINLIAVFLHSHLLGRAMKARHFRGNEELVPFADDKDYDFNYQEYRIFRKDVNLLPNDQITMECTYDSSGRSNVTFGGASTMDEMCLGFFMYYPLVNRFNSVSGPSYATINDVLNTNVTNEAEVYRVLSRYDWASTDIDEVQNAMRYSDHETQCHLGPFPRYRPISLVSYPSDLTPYEKESTCNVPE